MNVGQVANLLNSRSIRDRPLQPIECCKTSCQLVLQNQGGTTEASFVLVDERGFYIAMTNALMNNDKRVDEQSLSWVILNLSFDW